MDTNKIKQVLIEQLKLDEVIVNGDGSHFQIIAVAEMFNGMSRVKQQKVIYAPLMEYIADNQIHALSIKVYTPEEWTKR
ncbi:MAG: BolA family protein [Arsenophonus sp. NC-CH8-MAG3]